MTSSASPMSHGCTISQNTKERGGKSSLPCIDGNDFYQRVLPNLRQIQSSPPKPFAIIFLLTQQTNRVTLEQNTHKRSPLHHIVKSSNGQTDQYKNDCAKLLSLSILHKGVPHCTGVKKWGSMGKMCLKLTSISNKSLLKMKKCTSVHKYSFSFPHYARKH